MHDQPFATKHNGFGGLRRRAPDQPRVRRRSTSASSPPGRRTTSTRTAAAQGTADPKFVNGDCAMYIQSSALIGGFTQAACKFDWGTGELPHWGAPYKKATSIIGGATLWVMKGKPATEYRGVAQFLKFISEPNQQMWWHVNTGYLADLEHRRAKNLEEGYHFVSHPEQYTAFAELTGLPLTPPTALAGTRRPRRPSRSAWPRRTARASGSATSSRSATPSRPSSRTSSRARRRPSRAWTTPSRRGTTPQGVRGHEQAVDASDGRRRAMKRTVFKNRVAAVPAGAPAGRGHRSSSSSGRRSSRSSCQPLPRPRPSATADVFVGLDNFTTLLTDPGLLRERRQLVRLRRRRDDRARRRRRPLRGGASPTRRSAASRSTGRCCSGRTASRPRWRASSSCSSSIPPTACCRTSSRS